MSQYIPVHIIPHAAEVKGKRKNVSLNPHMSLMEVGCQGWAGGVLYCHFSITFQVYRLVIEEKSQSESNCSILLQITDLLSKSFVPFQFYLQTYLTSRFPVIVFKHRKKTCLPIVDRLKTIEKTHLKIWSKTPTLLVLSLLSWHLTKNFSLLCLFKAKWIVLWNRAVLLEQTYYALTASFVIFCPTVTVKLMMRMTGLLQIAKDKKTTLCKDSKLFFWHLFFFLTMCDVRTENLTCKLNVLSLTEENRFKHLPSQFLVACHHGNTSSHNSCNCWSFTFVSHCWW